VRDVLYRLSFVTIRPGAFCGVMIPRSWYGRHWYGIARVHRSDNEVRNEGCDRHTRIGCYTRDCWKSGVTKVGVIRCDDWQCHFFYLKSDNPYFVSQRCQKCCCVVMCTVICLSFCLKVASFVGLLPVLAACRTFLLFPCDCIGE